MEIAIIPNSGVCPRFCVSRHRYVSWGSFNVKIIRIAPTMVMVRAIKARLFLIISFWRHHNELKNIDGIFYCCGIYRHFVD